MTSCGALYFIFFFNFLGPTMSAALIKYVGFKGMLAGVAILTFLYAPLLFLLRNPTSREEIQVKTYFFSLQTNYMRPKVTDSMIMVLTMRYAFLCFSNFTQWSHV